MEPADVKGADASITPKWFDEAGLGLFVHWDHASQQGVEIGWSVVGRSIIPGRTDAEGKVSVEQYHSTAATFCPTEWDPQAVARLARESGARYVVFTVRHHGGYAMYHTRETNYSIEFSPYKRDITREFFDALRQEGLRIGVYYSLLDWGHPDYPAFRDADRPYVQGEHRRPTPEQWDRFISYLRGQLTELLTEYGQIDLLWFDGEWERTAEEWHAAELRQLIKSLQPDVVINDRLPGNGDYVTPEQGMPRATPPGRWELCLTMSESWAYRPDDTDYKSVRSLVGTLCEVAARGGNLLLNIGPRGDGSLVPTEVATLKQIGAWLATHGESVIGVRPASATVDFYGPVTERDRVLYLHLVMRPVEQIVVRNIRADLVTDVRLVGTETALAYKCNEEVHNANGNEDAPLGELFIEAPAATGALVDVVAIHFSRATQVEGDRS